MKPVNRNRRIAVITGGGLLIAGSAALVLTALNRSVSYFYTPSEAVEASLPAAQQLRLGGLVKTGSLEQNDNATVFFKVTDGAHSVDVVYTGILPDLFREGQGVIAQGTFSETGIFTAETILAKHDENYVPKELVGITENPDADY